MSNQYYMNNYTNGSSAGSGSGSAPVLPAYSSASEGSVIIPAPINNNNNNNNNNNKMEASNNNNNGSSVKLLIVTTIVSLIIAIVAIALSITARNEAADARDETKNAISAFIKAAAMINNNPSTTTTIIPTTTTTTTTTPTTTTTTNNNNNNNNNDNINMNTAVYAQVIYKATGGTNSQLTVPGQWFYDDSLAPPLTVPQDGVYLIMTTCRAYLNSLNSCWMCRLNRNNDPTSSLAIMYGGKVWGGSPANGDNSVSGFWIGELSAGDVIRQQYRTDGPATTYNTYARGLTDGAVGYSSIQLIRIGSSSSSLSSAVYAQAIYKTKGATNGEVSVPGKWWNEDSVAPPVKVPTDGTYLVLTTCRAILNNLNALWSCRLIRNTDTTNALSITYGGKVWGGNPDNGDGSVSGFWIGKLSSGDLIRQQYLIDGPSNTFNLYSPVDNGFSSIQIVRIGE